MLCRLSCMLIRPAWTSPWTVAGCVSLHRPYTTLCTLTEAGVPSRSWPPPALPGLCDPARPAPAARASPLGRVFRTHSPSVGTDSSGARPAP